MEINKIKINPWPNTDISNLTWDLLSLAISKNQFSERKQEVKSSKLENIRFIYDQAKELFNASTKSSYATFPLLQYYSFNLMAKLLIISKDDKEINTLVNSHGLESEINFSRNRSVKNLDDIFVKFKKKGTFQELLKISRDEDEYKIALNIDKISLGSILDRIIDLSIFEKSKQIFYINEYKEFEKPSYDINKGDFYFEMYIYTSSDTDINKLSIEFPDLYLDKLVKRTERSSFDSEKGTPYRYYFSKSQKNIFHKEINPFGKFFFVSEIKQGAQSIYLNQIELIFLLTFICSNLVRYYPDLWQKMITNQDYWLLQNALKYVSLSYPNHILNLLTSETNMYLPSNEIITTY